MSAITKIEELPQFSLDDPNLKSMIRSSHGIYGIDSGVYYLVF